MFEPCDWGPEEHPYPRISHDLLDFLLFPRTVTVNRALPARRFVLTESAIFQTPMCVIKEFGASLT